MVTKVNVSKLDLTLLVQTDDDCKSRTAPKPATSRHPVDVLREEQGPLFRALISPRRVTKEDLKEDFYAFETINQTFKDLAKLLIRSHDESIAGRQHRDKIKADKVKILQLRDQLHTTNLLGPRNTKNRIARVDLCEQYIQKLYLVCKQYLTEAQKVESPEFSPAVLTPRKGPPSDDLKKFQAAFQKKLRDAQNLKNSLVHRTMADICVLSESYSHDVELIENSPKVDEAPPVLPERTQSFFQRLLSPRKSIASP